MGIGYVDDPYSPLELDLLQYLLNHRCVSPPHAKGYEAIERDFRDKQNLKDVKKAMKKLMRRGIVGQTKKGRSGKNHFYISAGHAYDVLETYGRI